MRIKDQEHYNKVLTKYEKYHDKLESSNTKEERYYWLDKCNPLCTAMLEYNWIVWADVYRKYK